MLLAQTSNKFESSHNMLLILANFYSSNLQNDT